MSEQLQRHTITIAGQVLTIRFTFQAIRIAKKRIGKSPREMLMMVKGPGGIEMPAMDEDDVCELAAAGAVESDRTMTADRVAALLEREPKAYTKLLILVATALAEAYKRMFPALGEGEGDGAQKQQPSPNAKASPTASTPTAQPGISETPTPATDGPTSDG